MNILIMTSNKEVIKQVELLAKNIVIFTHASQFENLGINGRFFDVIVTEDNTEEFIEELKSISNYVYVVQP